MGTSLDTLSANGKALYDKLATIFGANNVIVTSTARAGTGSQHNSGDAIDFKVKGLSDLDAARAIAGSGIDYGQLIYEVSGPASTGPHVHIGAGTKKENLSYINGVYKAVSDRFGAAGNGELAPGPSNSAVGNTPSFWSDPAGATSAYFVRGSMVLIGGLILLVALWALLSHYDMVPSAVALGGSS